MKVGLNYISVFLKICFMPAGLKSFSNTGLYRPMIYRRRPTQYEWITFELGTPYYINATAIEDRH